MSKKADQKSLELAQFKMTISNLYAIVNRRLNHQGDKVASTKQLDKIGQFLVDLEEITQIQAVVD